MISVSNASASQAGSYYLQPDPVLQKDGEWQGAGAEALGLSGDVAEPQFLAVVSGLHPQTGEQLIADGGVDHDHRAGTDYSFSVPKDVSVAALVLDDERVLTAHETAVTNTMEFAEENFSQARQTTDGVTSKIDTGNMVIAKFEHSVNREDEPNLHTHALVINMTETDRGFRAVENREMYENRQMLDTFYKNELTHELNKSGINAEMIYSEKGVSDVKIQGLDDVSKIFSTRSEQIKEKAEELRDSGKMEHASDARLREIANKDTRKEKSYQEADAILAKWEKALTDGGFNKADLKAGYEKPAISENLAHEKADGKEIVRATLSATTEDNFSFSKQEIVKSALIVSGGSVSGKEITTAWDSLKKDGEIKEVKQPKTTKFQKSQYTTRDAQKTEKELERATNQYAKPMMTERQADQTISRFERESGATLDREHKSQVKMVLTSSKQVIFTSRPDNASNLKITKTAAKEKTIEHEKKVTNRSLAILGSKGGLHLGYGDNLSINNSHQGFMGTTHTSKRILTGAGAGTKIKSKSHKSFGGIITETTKTSADGGKHEIKAKSHGDSFYSVKTTSEKITDANGNVAYKTSKTTTFMGFKWGKSTTEHANGKVVERKWRGHDTKTVLGQHQVKITHDVSTVKTPAKTKFGVKLNKTAGKGFLDPKSVDPKERIILIDKNTTKEELTKQIRDAQKEGARVIIADKEYLAKSVEKSMRNSSMEKDDNKSAGFRHQSEKEMGNKEHSGHSFGMGD